MFIKNTYNITSQTKNKRVCLQKNTYKKYLYYKNPYQNNNRTNKTYLNAYKTLTIYLKKHDMQICLQKQHVHVHVMTSKKYAYRQTLNKLN